jgi:hypothetical protein
MVPLTNFIQQIFSPRAPSRGSCSALYYRRKVVRVGHNDHEAKGESESAWCPSATELDIGAMEGLYHVQRRNTCTFMGVRPDN